MNGFYCSDSSEKNPKDKLVYSNEFQGMLEGLDEEGSIEEMNCSAGKKRRLTINQVQALERIFEVDNKLDTERKIKLAQELGLQPRQVAIWFQNRRARWKTKQLERDYCLLKANYEALQLNYSEVEQEKEGLIAELRGLKEKLGEETKETNHSVEKASSSSLSTFTNKCNDSTGTDPSYMNHEAYTNIHFSDMKQLKDFKEGLSDESDSSGILNEDSHLNTQQQPDISRLASYSAFDGMDHSTFSLLTSFHHPPSVDSREAMMKSYQHQQHLVKMGEHNFFTPDDSCNMYPIDQTPLFWCFSDQRN